MQDLQLVHLLPSQLSCKILSFLPTGCNYCLPPKSTTWECIAYSCQKLTPSIVALRFMTPSMPLPSVGLTCRVMDGHAIGCFIARKWTAILAASVWPSLHLSMRVADDFPVQCPAGLSEMLCTNCNILPPPLPIYLLPSSLFKHPPLMIAHLMTIWLYKCSLMSVGIWEEGSRPTHTSTTTSSANQPKQAHASSTNTMHIRQHSS